MNAVRIAVTTIWVVALFGIAFFHAISGNWRFSANWTPHTELGGNEQQLYLQGVNEPGTFLLGWRSQPRISAVYLPVFSLALESPALSPGARASSGEVGFPRHYTLGVFRQSHDRPDQHFCARYLYLRFWLLEFTFCLLLAGIWTPVWIARKRAGRARSQQAGASEIVDRYPIIR